MSLVLPQDWTLLLRVVLVFLRLLGLFLFVPFFSHRSIPVRVRLLLALALSFALFPVVQGYIPALPEAPGGLAVVALKETIIGLLMGFIAYLTFEAIHLAGQFVGYQMGFGAAGVLDPSHSRDLSVMVPLQGWVGLMVFLLADLHHDALVVFVRSFEVTEALHHDFGTSAPLFTLVVTRAGQLFALAIQLAAPFCLVLLACNVLMGVLARMLPQMNILLFSFPVTILLGLMTIYVAAPEYMDFLENRLGMMSTDMMDLLKTL